MEHVPGRVRRQRRQGLHQRQTHFKIFSVIKFQVSDDTLRVARAFGLKLDVNSDFIVKSSPRFSAEPSNSTAFTENLMPIIEHPTIKRKANHDFYHEPALVVKCDFCRSLAKHCGNDLGDAADEARRLGFTTVKSSVPGGPRLWKCPACANSGR